MPDLSQFVGMLDAVFLPMLGIWSLIWSKISFGEAARRAERRFLLTLIVITMVTLRTVVKCDDAWLVHTITLAVMVVGALAIPNQDSLVVVSQT